jgi:hypothetical protein
LARSQPSDLSELQLGAAGRWPVQLMGDILEESIKRLPPEEREMRRESHGEITLRVRAAEIHQMIDAQLQEAWAAA